MTDAKTADNNPGCTGVDQRVAADQLAESVADFVLLALDQWSPVAPSISAFRINEALQWVCETGVEEGKRRYREKLREQRDARITKEIFGDAVDALDDEDDGDEDGGLGGPWSLIDIHQTARGASARISRETEVLEDNPPVLDLANCVEHLAEHIQRLENRLNDIGGGKCTK